MPGHFRRIAPSLRDRIIKWFGDSSWKSFDDFAESGLLVATNIPGNTFEGRHRVLNRPFETVEEMNHTILQRMNACVKPNDTLYFFGDFCIGPKARAAEIRKQIRCKKIFAVAGNHDKDTRKLIQEFSWLSDLAEVSLNGQRIVLCHYAMRVWNQSSRGAWHLYGHSHRRLPDVSNSFSMDVGVDTHDFRPWHFDEINRRMALKTEAAREKRQDDSSGERHDDPPRL